MHVPHQTVLLIHEERLNEMMGKNRVDYDRGIAAVWRKLWRNLRNRLPQQIASNETQTAPRPANLSTQELALVSKK